MEHEHATSLTARAVKRTLPDRAILTKDARQTLNSATSVFTLYLASLAHETSRANKRSTITLKDVLQTLRDADFEHFIEPIEACLREAKAAACQIKQKNIVAEEEEEGGDTTNEVVEQLDDVAIDTNEGDDDDSVMSVDEPSDAEEIENSPLKAVQDEGVREEESDNKLARDEETIVSDDDFAELMDQS